jgi:P-type Na+/K+ transporter
LQVLLLALALSFGVKDYIEGGVITAVVILNVTIGFIQEYRAEQQMDSLRALSSPTANVLRDGNIDAIPSAEVVPGDIVHIKTGDTIPADVRLIEAMNLECDEKILTGEVCLKSAPLIDLLKLNMEKAIPVAKDTKADFSDQDEHQTGVGDRINMAYSSSTVTKGRGYGIVVFTGMSTEIGKIAESMQGKKRKPNRSLSRKKHGNLQPAKGAALRTWDGIGAFLGLTVGTPLQRKLSKLAYILFFFAILLAIIVFGVNRFNVTNEVAIYAISTGKRYRLMLRQNTDHTPGIAMIPESLIAVLTITFVTGMTQMRKRKVLTRKLSALEALGGITNICSDKTGTLTQGQMVARKAWIPGVGIYSVDATNAFDPTEGEITIGPAKSKTQIDAEKHERQEALDRARSSVGLKFEEPAEKTARDEQRANASTGDEKIVEPESQQQLEVFLQSAALCNLATVRFNEQENIWQTTGDPTEVALQVFAHRFKKGKKTLELNGWKQLAEYPFDSTVKRMSVVYRNPDGTQSYVFAKGAVERIIDLCINMREGEELIEMNDEIKNSIQEQMNLFADQGLRVLAIARKEWDVEIDEKSEIPRDYIEKDLTLLGLAGLYDPPRKETKDAVRGEFEMS